jgi:hypothetical protein
MKVNGVSFSIPQIRARFSKKEDFASEITDAHGKNIEKAKLKKAIDTAWKEAFPKKDETEEKEAP